MDGNVMFFLLLAVMLIGSYLAGSIPLIVRFSEEKLKLVTVLGAGLLVGTALTVIIPEGIHSLYADGSKTINDSSKSENHEHNHIENYSSTIGLSLVLGFVFMLLVDQISQRQTQSAATTKGKNVTATIGLVVHAAADGVALGAAATTDHQDVEMIVFLAIMLHKAPAAFGLVSFLLHEKIERQQIRKHLGIFSLSAPLCGLITYLGIGQEHKETLNSINATGIAMLFSAGTFLYVATVHVLPELTASHGHGHGAADTEHLLEENRLPSNNNKSGVLKNSELIFIVFGALLPVILTFGHHH